MIPNGNLLNRLVTSILGDERTGYILRNLTVEPRLIEVPGSFCECIGRAIDPATGMPAVTSAL